MEWASEELTVPTWAVEDRATPRWLPVALKATLIFNLVDVVLTLALVTFDLAIEANPIMAAALGIGPTVFVAAKFALVFAGVITIWHYRDRKAAAMGAIFVTCIYALLMLYHSASVWVLVQHFSGNA